MLELMLVWAHLGVEILTYHVQLNDLLPLPQSRRMEMDDYNSETDSDYTSYWRDWVGEFSDQTLFSFFSRLFSLPFPTFDFSCFWGSRLEFLCAIISSHMSNGVCHSLHKEASFHTNKTLGGQHGFL